MFDLPGEVQVTAKHEQCRQQRAGDQRNEGTRPAGAIFRHSHEQPEHAGERRRLEFRPREATE